MWSNAICHHSRDSTPQVSLATPTSLSSESPRSAPCPWHRRSPDRTTRLCGQTRSAIIRGIRRLRFRWPPRPPCHQNRRAQRLVLGTAAVLTGQLAYVVKRDLPSFEGFDASGFVGHPDLPVIRIAALGDLSLAPPQS